MVPRKLTDSAIAKYIQSLTSLKFPKLVFNSVKDLTLDQAPLYTISTGIAVVRKFLDEHPEIHPENKTFKSLRKDWLLKDVVIETKSQFGDRWGLVAMHQACSGRGSKSTHYRPEFGDLTPRR